jgi:hypothetical protein
MEGLEPGQCLEFRVRTVNTAGAGPWDRGVEKVIAAAGKAVGGVDRGVDRGGLGRGGGGVQKRHALLHRHHPLRTYTRQEATKGGGGFGPTYHWLQSNRRVQVVFPLTTALAAAAAVSSSVVATKEAASSSSSSSRRRRRKLMGNNDDGGDGGDGSNKIEQLPASSPIQVSSATLALSQARGKQVRFVCDGSCMRVSVCVKVVVGRSSAPCSDGSGRNTISSSSNNNNNNSSNNNNNNNNNDDDDDDDDDNNSTNHTKDFPCPDVSTEVGSTTDPKTKTGAVVLEEEEMEIELMNGDLFERLDSETVDWDFEVSSPSPSPDRKENPTTFKLNQNTH